MPNDSIPTHNRRASRASFTASSRDIGCQRVRRARAHHTDAADRA
jgi:hypothetical protein